MTNIAKGIKIIDASLYFTEEKTIIIGDLHLGLEESYINRGTFLPKQQYNLIHKNILKILGSVDVKKIIINGDLKHEFSRINKQEWTDVYNFLNLLSKNYEVEIILGNHDVMIKKILKEQGYNVNDYICFRNLIVLHGDIIPEEALDKEMVIIGHEHPSVCIKEGAKIEKYKCFIKGRWKDKALIVMPSFNPLIEGNDILTENFLSPFINKDVSDFELFVIGNKVYNFGKVRNLS
ncbi:MAG TPA: metallophosphoesterase [Candidatus Nanoarchaeia archaeon]|nr:metallophosphoesterase [Candidatus Nanoarchaeia archaeon]